MKKYIILSLLLYIPLSASPATRRCIILLNKNDFAENVAAIRALLLNEQTTSGHRRASAPILVHASLWNSFIERRAFFAQGVNAKSSKFHKGYNLYRQINERIVYWHDYYRARTDDVIHMKELIVQHINQEFYIDAKTLITDADYQLLLNYLTPFDPSEWQIYTNQHGFFLMLPEKYCGALAADYDETTHGFKTSSLTRVEHPEQAGSLYFESRLQATHRLMSSLLIFLLRIPIPIAGTSFCLVMAGRLITKQ